LAAANRSQPGGEFGGTLAVGDVNGDGFDDLIATARFATVTGPGDDVKRASKLVDASSGRALPRLVV
jgi:hypothetical protein